MNINTLPRITPVPNPSNNIIVVSGLPRSGTSMMMRMLEAGGLDLLVDNIRVADQDNPNGYYEYEMVKALENGNTTWLTSAFGKVVKIIAALIPYLPDQYYYHIIFMNRPLPEILASQMKMLANRGKDPNSVNVGLMTKIYEKHLNEVDRWVKSRANVKCVYVNHHDLIYNPLPQIISINEFLGKTINIQKMKDAIDPSLYRQRKL